jgi:hypothetical protein
MRATVLKIRQQLLLISALLLLSSPGYLMAQGYGDTRPWGRLPYNPGPPQQAEQPKRYNPWAQMREAERLPPPQYRGEADENAPEYHEPDPTYRELPERHDSLDDPRAFASPWSQHYPVTGYGRPSTPYYPGAGMPSSLWGSGYPYGGSAPYITPWPWGAPGGYGTW